ncbi:hypothetical protein TMatcc_009319 [Talaromyces marneffei ATCC 18224]|uniref:Mannan endo-1,6-alpha-mannosidase n=2 Tax=Talaromyces marneffei TaxID=37727 RepID=B6QMM2_TALMQ|nr:uncharacterized protein EYB26_008581 [Talaromyces marneffei]EEA21278.1 conserved hypothetical protein [Talaromyces marneffei ATCC 18224]KAE8551211.1 hypothetical protein EYB25_007447 [Talaromyces marneffei]QGA20871.1 hypothetical protein EYB26_008581 [Talaromyces marneffei]
MRSFLASSILFGQLLLTLPFATAITVNPDDPNSLKSAASVAAASAVNYYNNRESKLIPGKFDGTWWEGGAFFTFLINYWHWTGDDQYNALVAEGLSWQGGEANDFFPSNYSSYLGNDDQEFWALAALTAIEQRFPDNPGHPSWLSLAQGAFNDFVARWEVDKSSCGGGLRWQLYPTLAGYDSKNAISNGGFFQIAARLARYTNNNTYATWAEIVWDWSSTVPLFDNSTWKIYDMTRISKDCKDQDLMQWSYNYGAYITGAAYMYNYTNGATKWKQGIDGLLNTTFSQFFPAEYGGNILSEAACDPILTCNRDQVCFKGLMANWLSTIALIAPYTYASILPKLQASAVGAGKQCSGPNSACGMQWFSATYDGTSAIEQEMSAMSIFANALVAFSSSSSGASYSAPERPAPVTADTGGNSTSDPTGGQSNTGYQPPKLKDITGGDRAGAAILTLVFASAWIGMMVWLVMGGAD